MPFCQASGRSFNLLKFSTTADVPQLIHEVHNDTGAVLHTVTLSLDQLTL